MRSVIPIALAALIISTALGAIAIQSIKAQPRPTQLPANIGNMTNPTESTGNHLPVSTVQDDRLIVTTVTKNGEPPTGPIVVIPPEPDKPKDNGTILTPGGNVTAPSGNVTTPAENVTTTPGGGNVTVISPGGNVTEIPGNITAIGNDTIIITEPGRNITETPGNVTVIDPPVGQTEQPATPANCTCNQQPAPIPPVTITPAPGQNVTTIPHPAENATTQPSPTTPPAAENNQTGNTSGLKPTHPIVMPPTSNETQNNPPPANNQTIPPANNSTGNNNNTNSTEPPHATQLPAATILPEFHINSVSYKYNGVNTQWLNK